MEKLNDGQHDLWFVEITGSQGECLLHTEKANVTVYYDAVTKAYFAYRWNGKRNVLEGIYAGNITIHIMPEENER